MEINHKLAVTIIILTRIIQAAGDNLPANYSLSKPQSNNGMIVSSPFDTQPSAKYMDLFVNEYEDSYSVIDIKIVGSHIWLATSQDVSHSKDYGTTWFHYDSSDGIGKGGVSGISASTDLVWTATIFDTLQYYVAGGGLSYTVDDGDNWFHLSQPLDAYDDSSIIYFGQEIAALPITTTISNITYDIAHIDSLVFISSWAGGLRKSIDDGNTWSRVLLPSDRMTYLDSANANEVGGLNPLDPHNGGNHNHKGFSVIIQKQNDSISVWCGTADGINKSDDGGLTWLHYTAQANGISGNWVVALHNQTGPGGDIIWAATRRVEGPGEENGVSYSNDNGNTWQTALINKRAWNFSSASDTLYVATSEGLYRSSNRIDWEWFENTVGLEVYSVAKDTTNRLWVGTSDGHFIYDDQPELWHEINFGSAPYFLSVSAPEIIERPVSEYYIDTIFVEVSDPDSIEDVNQVWFISLKPNGEYANNGDPIYLQNRGNGNFSTAFLLPAGAQLGTYRWTFTAQDLSGNLSEPVIHYIEVVDSILSTTEEMFISPSTFFISQNYPNPFNPVTTISYQISRQSFVNLSIYNIKGQLVDVLVNKQVQPGGYSVQWNAVKLSSGLYYYQLTAGENSATGKCILLK